MIRLYHRGYGEAIRRSKSFDHPTSEISAWTESASAYILYIISIKTSGFAGCVVQEDKF